MVTSELDQKMNAIAQACGDRLKRHGFRREGHVLRLLRDDKCGVIQFQRSDTSTRERIRFTLNVGVVCGLLIRKDLAKTRIGDTHVQRRITALSEQPHGDWWSVDRDANVAKISGEVSSMLEEVAVPFLLRLLAPDGLIEFLESAPSREESLLEKLRFLDRLLGSWSALRSGDEVTLSFRRDGVLVQEVTSGDRHAARRDRFVLDGPVLVLFRPSSSKLMRYETLERMRYETLGGGDLLLDYQSAKTRFARVRART
jgi:hypothetical protein